MEDVFDSDEDGYYKSTEDALKLWLQAGYQDVHYGGQKDVYGGHSEDNVHDSGGQGLGFEKYLKGTSHSGD